MLASVEAATIENDLTSASRGLLEQLETWLPPTGVAVAVRVIAARLPLLQALSPAARISVTMRLLELSPLVRGGKRVNAVIGVVGNEYGVHVSPERPEGVEPVGDEVIFTPLQDD